MDGCADPLSRPLDEALADGMPPGGPAHPDRTRGRRPRRAGLLLQSWATPTRRRRRKAHEGVVRLLRRLTIPAMPSYKATARIAADPQRAFDHLDDQVALAAHMTKRSAMMGGGRMTYAFDAARGQAVGSHIRMGGSAFGLSLDVDEVVTVREPPRRKAWATTGQPRLLVISGYRMGFDIEPVGSASRLTVWIEYDLPSHGLAKLLAAPFAAMYARWCVNRMLVDAETA